MRGIADNMLATGQEVSDEDLIMYILSGFGPEFESIMVNLNASPDSLTLNDSQVIDFVNPGAHVAARLFGNSQPRGGGFSSRGRGRFQRQTPPCQICGKQNHIASKCFKCFDMNFPNINLTSA
ncbi:hypothetical protein DH2020_023416 [Rehmannia glutinosa]|uniref:CCHC-type domain-containing protein n=1 Tax=Rehmannia glutinosa TaxID=99300 RepID=A0ABR0W5Z6_REHGL